MGRIVPSQAVEIIDRMFPWAANEVEGPTSKYTLNRENSTQLAAVIRLIEQIPSELIIIDGQAFAELEASKAAIQDRLVQWQHRDSPLALVSGLPKLSPISLIRRALAKCPDEYPSSDTSELNFVQDTDLRRNIRIDLSATNKALSAGEWKAATVLAGSILEALLLWALHQRDVHEIHSSLDRLSTKGIVKGKLSTDIATWHLNEYIEVAAELGLITEKATVQARLARDYRNLIHPGREIRLGQSCNRATALSAVAAVEHVIQELTRQQDKK